MDYSRHGDVTVEKIKKPKGFVNRRVDKLTLALGEVTNHSHMLIPMVGCEISILEPEEKGASTIDDILFEVDKEPALLIHEEHEPIILYPGIYVRKMKDQLNPFTGAIENVRD